MKNMKRINAGIIGIGFIGKQHIQAISELPYATVKAMCVHRKEQVQEMKQRYGIAKITTDWRDVIEDPSIDVIHNCTPNALHDEINLAAIRKGKHIYAEKPLSMNTEHARRLAEEAEKIGVANGVNYQYRMNMAVQEMKNRIANGKSGRILFAGGCYLQDSLVRSTDYTKRRVPETSPARALLDIGVHWADTISYVLGQPIVRVYAKMYTHHPIRIDKVTGQEIEIHSDDTTSVLVEFADGTPGQALFSKCMPGHKNDLVVTVSGEKKEYSWKQEECGRIYVGNQEKGIAKEYVSQEFCEPETQPFLSMPPGHEPGWKDAQSNAIAAFYDAIQQKTWKMGKLPYATFQDGLYGNQFVDACLESAKENRWAVLK